MKVSSISRQEHGSVHVCAPSDLVVSTTTHRADHDGPRATEIERQSATRAATSRDTVVRYQQIATREG